MRGRGSKLPILRPEVPGGKGRPSCRGVDRNRDDRGTRAKPKVAPHAGAWIETRSASSRPMASWVAPHAGAWIETRSEGVHSLTAGPSPLMQGRGSKQNPTHAFLRCGGVAPHAGAWIETRGGAAEARSRGRVAPHAGAWIETSVVGAAVIRGCRPSCRGVDRNTGAVATARSTSPSPLMQGRGSKLGQVLVRDSLVESPLMPGRGSNHAAEIGREPLVRQ